MVAELTPPPQRGAMLGINNAIVTLAGPLAPVCMGLIIDAGVSVADGFRVAFLVAGGVMTLGSLVGLMLINPEADRNRLAQGNGPGIVEMPEASSQKGLR